MLDCLIAICKRLGVKGKDIPEPMTPLGDAWLGDICGLVEIDSAANKDCPVGQEAPHPSGGAG